MVRIMIAGAAALIAATGFAALAAADPAKHKLPSNFNYETDGKSFERKGKATQNPDGTTRIEVPMNSRCVRVTVKSKTEYRTNYECKKPS